MSVSSARRHAMSHVGVAAATVVLLLVVGCSIDSEGYVHWTRPNDRDVEEWLEDRPIYWNGHHGEPTVTCSGIGPNTVKHRIDQGKLANLPAAD